MRKKRLAIIIKYWTFFNEWESIIKLVVSKEILFFWKISVNLFFFIIFGFGKLASYTIKFMLGQHLSCSIRIFFSENIRIVLGYNFLFYNWV